jgi:putative redox protein
MYPSALTLSKWTKLSENGGNDAGPESHELLLAALGSFASITVQMYADRKQWPVEAVHVPLSYRKVPAEDPPRCQG